MSLQEPITDISIGDVGYDRRGRSDSCNLIEDLARTNERLIAGQRSRANVIKC